MVFTDPQAASVGAGEDELSATVALSGVPRTSTYTRAYAERPGFLTLLSDGERLTGAYALGPEAGEWLQQATLAIRARVPLALLDDVIQPFPTFSEAFLYGLAELGARCPRPRSLDPPNWRVFPRRRPSQGPTASGARVKPSRASRWRLAKAVR